MLTICSSMTEIPAATLKEKEKSLTLVDKDPCDTGRSWQPVDFSGRKEFRIPPVR